MHKAWYYASAVKVGHFECGLIMYIATGVMVQNAPNPGHF